MPAKKKQASLKKTKSTTTYGRGGAKKKMYGGGAAKPMKKTVYQKGGAKKPLGKAVKAAAKKAKRKTVIDSKIKSKRPATLDNTLPKISRAQRGMGVGEEFINSMQEPRMRPNPVGPTPNDVRTDRFINAMDNVDRGLNRIFPGRPGRQRNRAIKRDAKQDARLNRSLDRINRDRGPRDINPEALPAANTRVEPNMIPIDPGMPSKIPGRNDGMINPRPVRVPPNEGGLSKMFRDASKGSMGLNEMGRGGVIKGSSLRNNSRGKARKNR